MSNKVIQGSCVCEKIHYELTGPPITNIICHCDNCRKITGSVFMANSAYTKEVSSKSPNPHKSHTYYV